VADQEYIAAAGGERERVEATAAQLRCRLGLYPQRLAGEAGGLRRPHPGAGQAGVDLGSQGGQRAAGGARLALSLRGQSPCRVVTVAVLGVAVAEQIDHAAILRGGNADFGRRSRSI